MATSVQNFREQFSSSLPYTQSDIRPYVPHNVRETGPGAWIGLAALGLVIFAGYYFGPEALRYFKTMRM